jgi:PPK2 family polyphosphate:nucleotide phosphotransferase
MKALKKMLELSRQFRIEKGKGFRLKDVDTADTGGLKSAFKDDAQKLLQQSVQQLASLQDKLYAQDRWSLLLIFQAMDAAGKDSTIKHVMSGVNPQGVQVYSFKQPSSEELDHDYLWRCVRCLPERGRIGIFNRSYYEEVLVVKVHSEILKAEKLPEELISKKIWKERYEDINAFELHLARNGTKVCKFFLHVSKEEQKERFLARLEEPEKNWKYSAADVKERLCWDDYQDAYEEAIRATATQHAPWYVVPADHKWFTRLMVGAAVTDTILNMNPAYPTVSAAEQELLQKAKEELESQ